MIKQVPGLPRAIICDLDRTLCLFGNKNPYERDFENDEINEAVRFVLDGAYPDAIIIFVSGRKDKFRKVTQEWLNNRGFGNYPLFMRKTLPNGEKDPKDSIVKAEIYEQNIKGKYNVLFVLDDRLQVCRLWYMLGLTVFRVGDPDADF